MAPTVCLPHIFSRKYAHTNGEKLNEHEENNDWHVHLTPVAHTHRGPMYMWYSKLLWPWEYIYESSLVFKLRIVNAQFARVVPKV